MRANTIFSEIYRYLGIVGEDVELSPIADANIKWYDHFGKIVKHSYHPTIPTPSMSNSRYIQEEGKVQQTMVCRPNLVFTNKVL